MSQHSSQWFFTKNPKWPFIHTYHSPKHKEKNKKGIVLQTNFKTLQSSSKISLLIAFISIFLHLIIPRDNGT
jgi:hypothetical protein